MLCWEGGALFHSVRHHTWHLDLGLRDRLVVPVLRLKGLVGHVLGGQHHPHPGPLRTLHVRQPVSETVVHPDFYTGTPASLLPNYDEELATKLERDLDEFARVLTADIGGTPGLKYNVTLLQQFKAREAIVDHVNQCGADVVVHGTRGHTTLRNLLIGSTAEKIIHGSRCSALAVKPDGFEYELD